MCSTHQCPGVAGKICSHLIPSRNKDSNTRCAVVIRVAGLEGIRSDSDS